MSTLVPRERIEQTILVIRGRRYLPYAFTEQGVAMLSSVLRSKRTIHPKEDLTHIRNNANMPEE